MQNEEVYLDNLNKWIFLNSDYEKKLNETDISCLSIQLNEKGLKNLVKKNRDTIFNYYSDDPQKEAKQWFLNLNLKAETLLYVYGIGLGLYYEVLKTWLDQDKKRYVFFLEDDLEVIKFFLNTETATDLLNNPQCSLIYFDNKNYYFRMKFVTSIFPLNEFKFSTLNSYKEHYFQKCNELNSTISHEHQMYGVQGTEYLVLNKGYVHNFYKNLHSLKRAKHYINLMNEFKNIPVVICGAGPSLEKNVHLLKQLKNKAIIMAGGTSMNVLNSYGITPHFGLGIDPNPSHYNRLISNVSFETPFFYRQRIYPQSLDVVHGEIIYVNGAGGYKITDWFEKTLNIPQAKNIEEGYNVVNFSLALASFIGCNPILLIGVDLAYSNNKSYADGLINHASQDPKTAFLTKSSNDELLIKDDIFGQPVQTLWKWINESLWYTYFAAENPSKTILNCTEGGIGFSQIANSSLKQAKEMFLTQEYDLDAIIHGALQNDIIEEKITQNKIIDALKKFNESLINCESLCQNIIQENTETLYQITQNQKPNTHKLDEYLKIFNEEIGKKYLLNDYIGAYTNLFLPHHEYIESNPNFQPLNKIKEKRIQYDITMYSFILSVIQLNINLISKSLNDFSKSNDSIRLKPSEDVLTIKNNLRDTFKIQEKENYYFFENNHLKIEDKELSIHIDDTSKAINEKSFYDNGFLKSDCFRVAEKLHGPFTFFSRQGNLLSKHWYHLGKRVGKWIDYYSSGEIYSVVRYNLDMKTKTAEYYYQDGLPKSILNYDQDQFHGQVILFYPNGRVKRKIDFSNGKKEGLECYWNEDGRLIFESYYKDNRPVGIARQWHSNGKIAKEIDHDKKDVVIRAWDEKGVLLNNDEDDYFFKLSDNSKLLNSALNQFYRSLVNIAPFIKVGTTNQGEQTSIEDDLIRLKQEMDQLDLLKQKIEDAKVGNDSNEHIWKTVAVEKMMQEKLGTLTNELNATFKETESNMQKMIEELNKIMNLPPSNPNE